MGMLEDVIKALERIPLWKRVSALPVEVEALQLRVAALEARLAGKTGPLCPLCNTPGFKRISSKEHPDFGFAGLKVDSYVCENCGHKEDRERDEGTHR
jgi:ribosomal protein L37AE/L43A